MKVEVGSVRRRIAAILVGLGAAGAALSPVLLLNAKSGGPGPMEPPWAFPSVEAEWDEGAGWNSARDLVGPAAVMYVDRSCVHCKAELQRWAAAAATRDERVDFWVIASPSSVMDGATWVPPSLRDRTVWDGDGSVARALGVNAVPVTFWLDGADTVRIVDIGQTTRQTLIENIGAVGQPGGES